MGYFEEKALPFVLIIEGGYTDDPDDRGGKTNKGITQKEYDRYRVNKGIVVQEVRLISDEEVRDIYYNNYWLPSRCDKMENELAMVVFDTSVNNGQSRSIKILQEAIGAKVDGVIGQETIYKLTGFKQSGLAQYFMLTREKFYHEIVKGKPSQIKFLKGWLRRAQFVKDFVSGKKTLEQVKKEW